MNRFLGQKTSRVLDAESRSFQTLIARAGKAISDSEGILLQDIQAVKLRSLEKVLTHSGYIDLPAININPENPNSLLISPFQALIAGELLQVQGTNNPNSPLNLDNILYLPTPPESGYGIVMIYLEMWSQVLDEDPSPVSSSDRTVRGYYINTNGERFFYPYGNTQANTLWIQQPSFKNDVLLDPSDFLRFEPRSGITAPFETSGRVQTQYAIRVAQINPNPPSVEAFDEHIATFGMTHPNLTAQTLRMPSQIQGITPFKFNTFDKNPGLYVAGDEDPANYLRTVDGCTYALPLAIVFQRNTGVFGFTSNPFGTAKNTPGDANTNTMISGRPDGGLPDKVTPYDIIDTRSSFLLGSIEDYDSYLQQAFSRLLRGRLNLKLATGDTGTALESSLKSVQQIQELLGSYDSNLGLNSKVKQASTLAMPRLTYTSDETIETTSYKWTPSMKTTTNTITWENNDELVCFALSQNGKFLDATAHATTQDGRVVRLSASQVLLSGLGTNTLGVKLINVGFQQSYATDSVIHIQASILYAGSSEKLLHVPEKLHVPFVHEAGNLWSAAGFVSDYENFHEFSVYDLNSKYRSYRKNHSAYRFGTVKVVRVRANDIVPITAPPPGSNNQPPSINNFSSEPPSSILDKVATLEWTVTSADKVLIDHGIGEVPLSGTLTLRISEEVTYTLTAISAGGTTSQQVVVTPPEDLKIGSSSSSTPIVNPYTFPGGFRNPENIDLPYYTAQLPVLPPLGDTLKHSLIGCIKATYFRWNVVANDFDPVEVLVRYERFAPQTQNDGITYHEIGMFGDFDVLSPTDYLEVELLITNLKTLHFNENVQGISAFTETVALSSEKTIFCASDRDYSVKVYPSYSTAENFIVASIPVNATSTTQHVGGVFESVWGFNNSHFCFVKLATDDFYRTIPCTVLGLGTPFLHLTIDEVAYALIEDVIVLAQMTYCPQPTDKYVVTYDYIPYQGEGNTLESYSLKYLDQKAVVTTFGTGRRLVPGIQDVTALNPKLPVASVLPSLSGWQDSDLKNNKISVGSQTNNMNQPLDTISDFLLTTPLNGNTSPFGNLLSLSAEGFNSLAPRGATNRGFSRNIVHFSFAVETPVMFDNQASLDKTHSNITLWVNSLIGDDNNPGVIMERPKKTLQSALNALPPVLDHEVTILLDGDTSLTSQAYATLPIADVVPYGKPSLSRLSALGIIDVKTQGAGKLILRKNTNTNNLATLKAGDQVLPLDGGLCCLLIISGEVELYDIRFESDVAHGLLVYPGASAKLSRCSFKGGDSQLVAYNSRVIVDNTSFSDPVKNHVVATVSGQITFLQGVSFSKGSATGYTFLSEKNSIIEITKPLFLATGYNNSLDVEGLAQLYSMIDTHPTTGFSFPATVQAKNFSSIIANPTSAVGSSNDLNYAGGWRRYDLVQDSGTQSTSVFTLLREN